MVAMCRPDVEALARDPALSPARIAAAIEARDYEAALATAIAHLVAKRELPIESVAPIMEGDPEPYILLHVAGKATGDRAAALFDMIARGRIPYEDTIVAMLYVAWRTGDRDAIRAQVIRTLRVHLTPFDDEEVHALAAILVDELDDPHLRAAAELQGIERDAELEPYIANAIDEPISKLLAALPPEAVQKNAGFTVRAAEKPGRNEPCPCGSGKKYKKCCADKPDEGLASPLPGVSWTDYLREGAPTMTPEDIVNLAYDDLVRVDLTKLADVPLIRAFRRFMGVRDWPYALRALEAMGARGMNDDGHAHDLLTEAVNANDIATARTIRERWSDDDSTEDELLAYHLLVDPATALERIERLARAALADGASPVLAFNLAFGILRAYPALGILVGRDLVDGEHILDAETMVIEIERARALLDLPVDKRINDRWQKIEQAYIAEHDKRESTRARAKRAGRGKSEPASDPGAETRALRSSLVAENERATRLERELAAARDALATASRPAAIASATPSSDDALRSMRDRVQKLEVLIREGNEERAELRKKLDSTAKVAPKPTPPPSAPVVEEDPGDPVEVRGRRVAVPIWKPDAIRSLEALPASVAALAIRTTGELAAADDSAWHQVKQARDMATPIYMARVGIHHRLLFEMREGRLEVLDVITRETLLHVLKRIRAR